MSALDYYKYKGTPISALIKGFQTGSVSADTITAFNLNSSDTIDTEQPFTGVDEKPKNIDFKLNNVDISDFAIANYVIPNNGDTITVPSWCTNIKYVLCGGGGGGGKATSQTVDAYYFGHHNSGFNWVFLAGPVFHNQQTGYVNVADGNAKGGGGGGAGAFYYTSNLTVTPATTITVTVGSGGSGGENGNASKLILSSGQEISCPGGAKGSLLAGGDGGDGNTTGNDGSDGTATTTVTGGAGGSQTKNKSNNTYGKGGAGKTTTRHSYSTAGGEDGKDGFVLIYFMS